MQTSQMWCIIYAIHDCLSSTRTHKYPMSSHLWQQVSRWRHSRKQFPDEVWYRHYVQYSYNELISKFTTHETIMEAKNKEYTAMADSYHIQHKEEILGEDWLYSYLSNTKLDANYEKEHVTVELKTTTAHDISTKWIRNSIWKIQHPIRCLQENNSNIWYRLESYLRALNKVVVRKQYPLLMINDILRNHNDYSKFKSSRFRCNIAPLSWT